MFCAQDRRHVFAHAVRAETHTDINYYTTPRNRRRFRCLKARRSHAALQGLIVTLRFSRVCRDCVFVVYVCHMFVCSSVCLSLLGAITLSRPKCCPCYCMGFHEAHIPLARYVASLFCGKQCNRFTTYQTALSVEPRSSALNITLPAFDAERGRLQ